MSPVGTFLHVDMDAFFAAVEQRDNPALRGKPVLVGGAERGVVTTASYEARPFGCKSGMPMREAMRLCPHAVVVKPNFQAYSAAGAAVREILRRFSPDITPLGLDEAFVDLTRVANWSGLDRGREAAVRIRAAVLAELSLTASVGVAPNRFLAKVGSDHAKPDGVLVIPLEEAPARLAPMSVGVLRGVGKVTRDQLEHFGVRTVADLLATPEEALLARFGEIARSWRRLAVGEDSEHSHEPREHQRSIGKEHTFAEDIGDAARLRSILLTEVESVARSLRAEGLLCRTLTLKLRDPDFQTHTRSHTLNEPTDRTDDLWAAAQQLLDAWITSCGGRPRKLRLLGVSLKELGTQKQLGLFEAPREKQSAKLDAVADAINAKFGKNSIRRAGGMNKPRDR
jgi:DNA polymerase-4